MEPDRKYLEIVSKLEDMFGEAERAVLDFGENSEEFRAIDDKLNDYLYSSNVVAKMRDNSSELWQSYEDRYLRMQEGLGDVEPSEIGREENYRNRLIESYEQDCKVRKVLNLVGISRDDWEFNESE